MPDREIQKIKDELVSRILPERIYLFGSFAEGKGTDDSDFDFYIVMKDGVGNLTDLTAEAYRAIRKVRTRAVDLILGTESRFEERKNSLTIEHEVAEKGVLLYGKENESKSTR